MSERPKSLPEEIQAFQPEVGLVLGSGLGFFADDRIEVAGRVDYKAIDGFPVSTVPGHAGRLSTECWVTSASCVCKGGSISTRATQWLS